MVAVALYAEKSHDRKQALLDGMYRERRVLAETPQDTLENI